MKCTLILSLIMTTLFSNMAYADRTLILFGGGGEPKELSTTIFDKTLNSLDNYLQENEWKHIINFNGGHAKTEAIMSEKFGEAQNKSSFTKNNFNAIIKAYENQLRSDKFKPGDQLMVMIDSHGAAKSPYTQNATHEVSVGQGTSSTNLSDLSGTETLSLDSLKTLTELAREKGVKLAIVDFSCHSGNTLPLANENTCVISASGPNHFGYTAFSDDFIKKMKAGKSLEDVFLETRKNSTDNSFPMISTEEGKTINRDLYPDITPYLYYYEKDPRLDKMTNYLISTSTQQGLCSRQSQYEDLLKQLDSIKLVSDKSLEKSMPEIEKIKGLIAEYKERQDRYLSLLRSWGVPELSRNEQFNGVGIVGRKKERMTSTYTWKEMMEIDVDTILENVTNAKNATKDPATQAQFQSSIDLHTKVKQRRQEILAQYPNLKDYKQKLQAQLQEMQGTYDVVNKIAQEERKLYDSMYASLRQEKKRSNNACRGFVL